MSENKILLHEPDVVLTGGSHIIAGGNLKDGFEFTGPFSHFEEALAYMEDHKLADAYVMELLPPTKKHHHKS